MAFSTSNIMLPSKGVVAVAPPHTAPPNKATFDPLAVQTVWAIAHTSRKNNAKMKKDGGDETKYGSWFEANLLAIREDVTYSFEYSSLQWDYESLNSAWPGGRVTGDGGYAIGSTADSGERAVYVWSVNSGKTFAIYMPRVSLAINDLPEMAIDELLELPLSGTTLAATQAVGSNVKIGDTIIWYPPSAVVAPVGP